MKLFIRETLRAAIAIIALGAILSGLYPAVVWVAGQVFFHEKANGSLLLDGEKIVGSKLLAQGFAGREYFHPRPSAAGAGYDGASSGGSNLGPLSRTLLETVRKRSDDYRKENGLSPGLSVPVDAVTSSASGLDPHISVGNALIQAKRVARERGISREAMLRKISGHTEGRTFGFIGEPRVNVLTLNYALDGRL